MMPHTTAMSIQSAALNPNIGFFLPSIVEKPDSGVLYIIHTYKLYF
jgi:hypothetical protein